MTLLLITDVIEKRRDARRYGVSRMLSSMRLFFRERMSEKDADDASFFVAMLADRLGEEQKADIVEQTPTSGRHHPKSARSSLRRYAAFTIAPQNPEG